jgi:hypothetical protein
MRGEVGIRLTLAGRFNALRTRPFSEDQERSMLRQGLWDDFIAPMYLRDHEKWPESIPGGSMDNSIGAFNAALGLLQTKENRTEENLRPFVDALSTAALKRYYRAFVDDMSEGFAETCGDWLYSPTAMLWMFTRPLRRLSP